MTGPAAYCDLFLIRHAPADTGGRLCGRTDVDAVLQGCSDQISALRRWVGAGDKAMLVSPAKRCVQTAQAVWPGAKFTPDPRLWEQDFGAWDGQPVTELPDLGQLDRTALAAHQPPGGESFANLCTRAQPVFRAIRRDTVVVAHAGTIRAALCMALEAPAAGLAFDIATLSLTRLRRFNDGTFAVLAVNEAHS